MRPFPEAEQRKLNAESPTPTVRASANFKVDVDAKTLHEAMGSFSTNGSTIISLVSQRSTDQRIKIRSRYKQNYGLELLDQIQQNTSGNFCRVLKACFEPRKTLLARFLGKALRGVGTSEPALIETICAANNREIRQIKTEYKKLWKCELEEAINDDCTGDFKRILISLINGDRDEGRVVDPKQAAEDAQQLYQAGEGMRGTNEEIFNRIFCSRSIVQLKEIIKQYKMLSGKTLIEAIQIEFSGEIRHALEALVEFISCPAAFFAHAIKKTMKGLGTNDRDLIRLIVWRSEIDMVQVKKAFYILYEQPMEDWIEDDTSGSYRNLLLALIGS